MSAVGLAGSIRPGGVVVSQIRQGAIRLTRDPLQVALFVLVLLTLSRLHQHYSFLRALRPMQVLVAAALCYAVLNPRFLSKEPWLRQWPARVVAALAILACVSAPFGLSLGSSARYLIDEYVKVLILSFLLMASIRGVADLLLYVWGYVAASGVLAWMALFVFDPKIKGGGARMERLHGMYTYDSNDLCVLLLAGLGLTLFTLQMGTRRSKLASLVIMLGIGATLARTGSRGGFLGLVVFGVAALLLLDHVPLVKRLMTAGLVFLSLTLAAPAGYWKQMGTLLQPTDDYNWTSEGGRKESARRGMQYMLRYPIFGLGLHNYQRAEGTISERAIEGIQYNAGGGVTWRASHNSYVQAGAELGIPGFVLWSALPIGGFVAMLRLRRRIPRWWMRADPERRMAFFLSRYLAVGLAGFSVSTTFVSFAWLDPIYVIAALMTGLLLTTKRLLRDDAQGVSRAGGGAPPVRFVAGPDGPGDDRSPRWRGLVRGGGWR